MGLREINGITVQEALALAQQVITTVGQFPGVRSVYFRHRMRSLPSEVASPQERESELRPLHEGLALSGQDSLETRDYGLWRVDDACDLALIVTLEEGGLFGLASQQVQQLAALAAPLAYDFDFSAGSRASAFASTGDTEPRETLFEVVSGFPFGTIFVLGPDLHIWAGGGAELTRLGVSEKRLIGRRATDVLPAALGLPLEEEHRATFARGAISTRQVSVRGNHYLSWVGPIRGADGAIRAVMQVVQVVTRRSELEEKVSRLETLLDEMQRVGRMGTWTMDLVTGELRWSERACELHGIPAERAPVTSGEAIQLVAPDERAELERRMSQARSGRGAVDVTYRLDTTPPRWIRSRAEVIYDARPRMFGILQDVSEETQLERERERHQAALEAAKARAEAGERSKSAFLALMSHELRTPLNGILASASMLRAEGNSREHDELTSIVTESGEALLHTIDDILDLTLLDVESPRSVETAFSLRVCVEKAVSTHRAALEAKGTTVEISVPDEVADARLGDGDRIRRALSKLLGPAVRSSNADRLRICVRPAVRGIRFRVEDPSPGYGPGELKKLLAPFDAAERLPDRRYQGSELALFLAQQIVQSVGGEFEAAYLEDSRDPQQTLERSASGSTLGFTVPLPESPAQKPSMQPHSSSERVRFSPLRILVAEDNPVNQKVVERILRKLGHRVTLAEDGATAVAKFEQGTFDLVLMDLQMPAMDGLEATRMIRAWEERADRPRTPIWALTANALDTDRAQCLEAGMDRFLSKPLRLTEIGGQLSEIQFGSDSQVDTSSRAP